MAPRTVERAIQQENYYNVSVVVNRLVENFKMPVKQEIRLMLLLNRQFFQSLVQDYGTLQSEHFFYVFNMFW